MADESFTSSKWYSTEEMMRHTGLSYGTLLALTRQYGDRIPVEYHRSRLRYGEAAIPILQELWRENQRPGPTMTAQSAIYNDLMRMLREIQKTTAQLSASVASAITGLKRYPPIVTGYIHSIPGQHFDLKKPLSVLVEPAGRGFTASLPEADLAAQGRTRQEAIRKLRELIGLSVERLLLSETPDGKTEQSEALGKLVERRRAERPLGAHES
jgi:predicted RNase H-like HicB family nuclease